MHSSSLQQMILGTVSDESSSLQANADFDHNTIELAEAAQNLDAVMAEADAYDAVADDLEDLQNEVVEASANMTPELAASYVSRSNFTLRKYGVDKELDGSQTAGLESAQGDTELLTTWAFEDIGNKVKNMAKSLLVMVKKVFTSVADFFKKLFSALGRLEGACNTFAQVAMGYKGKDAGKGDTPVKSKWLYGFEGNKAVNVVAKLKDAIIDWTHLTESSIVFTKNIIPSIAEATKEVIVEARTNEDNRSLDKADVNKKEKEKIAELFKKSGLDKVANPALSTAITNAKGSQPTTAVPSLKITGGQVFKITEASPFPTMATDDNFSVPSKEDDQDKVNYLTGDQIHDYAVQLSSNVTKIYGLQKSSKIDSAKAQAEKATADIMKYAEDEKKDKDMGWFASRAIRKHLLRATAIQQKAISAYVSFGSATLSFLKENANEL